MSSSSLFRPIHTELRMPTFIMQSLSDFILLMLGRCLISTAIDQWLNRCSLIIGKGMLHILATNVSSDRTDSFSVARDRGG